VKGYDVYRDGTKVNTVTTPPYTDRGLAAGGSYVYTVRAVDRAGNQSPLSNAVTVGPAGSSGDGLKGEYYDNMDLTAFKLSRTDRTVSFNWGTGSPASTIGVDTYSVRWTGEVKARYSQLYTFYTNTDDGVRLWVNGQLLIDKWVNQAATQWSGTIALTAGRRYAIRMEYFDNTGDGLASLQWSSASQVKEVIPQGQLFSTATVQANLIRNPGLETGTVSPWTTWQDAGVSNTNARTGLYAGRVGANPATLEQVVTLKPNTRYELRGFARVTTAGDSVMVGIKSYGGANKFVTIGSTTYREAVVEFTTGATNTSGTVFLYKYLGAGNAYGDDFSLVELGSPTARVDAAGAEAAGGDRQVRLYPNPTDDQFTLHYFSPAEQGVKVTLANAVGRPVKTVNRALHAGDNQIVVGTRDLPTGLYLVNVVADDGSVTPLKVVISR
jgi:hypothetical protein